MSRAKEVDGTTALHYAAHYDDAELVKRLIKAGADLNAANDYGATPLGEAAVTGDPDDHQGAARGRRGCEVDEQGRPDAAHGRRAHRQRRSREAAAQGSREREREGAVGRADGAHVGGGAEPAADGEAAHPAQGAT